MEAKEIKPFRPPCDASSEMVNVKAILDKDVSSLLPFIKGDLDNVKYFPKGPFIKFMFNGHPVTMDHDCIAIAGFRDDQSARECAGKVIELLKDIEARKEEITPDSTPFNPPTVIDVYRRLPKKNGCGKCGYPTCMAFAVALTKEETGPEMCPEIAESKIGDSQFGQLKQILGV